jgi:hypothetical protein
VLALVNLFRGSKRNPSIFGVERCSIADWTALGFFLIVCIIVSYLSILLVRREQKIKLLF